MGLKKLKTNETNKHAGIYNKKGYYPKYPPINSRANILSLVRVKCRRILVIVL
jgi:hypothetical protein